MIIDTVCSVTVGFACLCLCLPPRTPRHGEARACWPTARPASADHRARPPTRAATRHVPRHAQQAVASRRSSCATCRPRTPPPPPCADSSPYLSWTRLWDGWCGRPGCRRHVKSLSPTPYIVHLLQDGILQQGSPTAPFRLAGPQFPPESLSPRCFFHRWTGLRRS